MKTLLIFALTLPAFGAPVFLEKKGVLVIEAESTSSRLRKWKKKTDVKDFTGECHIEFTGNKTVSGPPNSPLKYQFKINKAGKYTLSLRARKRLEGKRSDISNDCYIAMKGDFEAGGQAALKILKADTKIYGGEADRWGWAGKLDSGHKKFLAEYLFKKDETYTLTISGRSKNFNIDRILIVHESKNWKELQRKNPSESKIDGPVERTRLTINLTNIKGITIRAELIELKDNQLTFVAKGRRHTLPLETLTAESQEAVKAWAEGP